MDFIFIPAMLAVVFFFFLRPQAKKQKAQEKFVVEIKKGDQVVTTSGIIGRVSKIEEHSVSLQLDQKTFINVVPNAISMEMSEDYRKKLTPKASE